MRGCNRSSPLSRGSSSDQSRNRDAVGLASSKDFATSLRRTTASKNVLPLTVIMDELGHEHGFQYETAKAAIDESAIGSRASDPSGLVLLLAKAKAEAIIPKLSSADSGYLLTCDQVLLTT